MLSYLLSKWTGWGKPAAIRKQAPARRRLIPRVEFLEDRWVPSTTIAEYPVATSASSPYGITAGPGGTVWFTEYHADQIGVINATTHSVSEFPVTTANSGPLGITLGPDGNLWFTEFAADQIGRINATTHDVTEFSLPTANSEPSGITVGPDGNIWFTEFSGNKIGEINPGTGVVSEYPVPTTGGDPLAITTGPDGNLWFTETNGNNIGTITPTNDAVTEYPVPQKSSVPDEITAGSNGNIYFTENSGNAIGAISTSTHTFSDYPVPTSGSGPLSITTGPDGNIWFTGFASNQIGELNLATGVVTVTAVPTASASPAGIISGPAGALWFTESNGNQIGAVVALNITTAPVNQTITQGQPATFTAAAAGFGTPAVQWVVSTNAGATFTPLTNTGVYSGVTTDTLTITDAPTTMSGYVYEAVFTSGSGPTAAAITSPAILTVRSGLSITPALPQGIVGESYNQTLSVLGSTTPFDVFTVNNFQGGTTGLTASDITTNSTNGTIVISGTPTAAGTATFNVTIANTGGDSLSRNLVIKISAPLSIATTSLPNATAGSAYSQAVDVGGGVLPYTTFSVTNFNAGTTGLKASDITAHSGSGVFDINGTAVAGGSATFTVNVTDSAGTTVTNNFTIIVNPPLVISGSLPGGTTGTSYSHTLSVTGGGTPYASLTVKSFTSSAAGLTLGNVNINTTTNTVTLAGTPTSAGTVTFTVKAVDAVGAVLKKSYTVTINPVLTITSSLPQGTAEARYDRTIKVAGGTKPYSIFTVTGFSAGTTGLTTSAITLDPNTGKIVINGTPSAAGTAAFTVNVTDAAGSQLTHTYSVTINPALTLGNLTATQWTEGVSGFTGVISLAGGTGPCTIAGTRGLPTGLTADLMGNTIQFAGTPSVAKTFASGSITLTDAAGAVATKTFSITINPTPAIGKPTATQWTVDKSGFMGTMTVTGGTGAYSLTSFSGLPAGLTAFLSGDTIHFAGTPTATGNFAGSVKLHDAAGAVVTRKFTLTINPAPTLSTLTTTQWTEGKSGFTGVIPISGGTGPFTIASSSGLPTGLTAVVSGNKIHFTGTPSAAHTFASESITLHDAAGASVTTTFTITINPPLEITNTNLPAPTNAVAYTAAVHTEGGTGAVTFAVTAGSLPPGLTLSKTGIISGVPRGKGSFTCTITATDAIGDKISEKYEGLTG